MIDNIPIHPFFVHFPIAFLIAYVITEILYFVLKRDFLNKLAFIFLSIGVIGALLSVITGQIEYNKFEEIVERTFPEIEHNLEEHEKLGKLTLIIFSLTLIIRISSTFLKKFKTFLQVIVLLLSIIGSYVLFKTGIYGGNLVYKHGIGTKLFDKK